MEIKYRAYDDEKKSMLEWREIGPTFWDTLQNLATLPHLHIMQFTGLLDKFGYEIYENDIIAWVDKDGHEHYHIVRWSNEWACFDLPMKAVDDGTKQFCEMEIVGNTHESPKVEWNKY